MFKYTAFISYSNASKRTAVALHKRLESYTVPHALRVRKTDQKTIDKSLGVFCVDRREFSATAHLGDEIRTAVSDSKFLIVLCTPQAAQSEWVLLEIEYFKSLGRADHILPVIVDGEPEVFDEETSPNGAFPREIFMSGTEDIEFPLAPDFRDPDDGSGDGDEVAFLRIVARLLGVRFPELTQRHLVAEKQKRLLRNRIITALAVMLILTVTGGTLAWNQKQAADKRLAQALQTASKQVQLAAEFRPRYGIPSSVSLELFSSASKEFDTIASEAGNSPDLLLNRARYSLGMANLMTEVQGSERASLFFLQNASRDIDAARVMSEKWYAKHWFHSVPQGAQILREEVRALELMSSYSAVGQSGDEALRLAEQALNLSKQLKSAGDTTIAASQDLVFSACALADIKYTLGRRLQSETTYAACLKSAQTLWESQPTPGARSIFVNALIDYGMISRLDPTKVDEAIKLHERAVEMARSEQANAKLSNDDYLLLANALVSYADTVNRAGGPLDVQLDHYQQASEILTDLIATDLNRKDWKTLRSLALYREAGVYARQAMALDQLPLLEDSKNKFSEGIDLLEPLVQRFVDDVEIARTLSAFYENRAEVNVLLVENAGDDNLRTAVTEDMDALVRMRLTLFEGMQDQNEQKVLSRDLAQAYLNRARFGTRLNEDAAHISADFAKARTIFGSLEPNPDFQPDIYRDLALTELEEAELWFGLGDPDKACARAQAAQAHMKSLLEASSNDQRNQRDSAYTDEQVHVYCE